MNKKFLIIFFLYFSLSLFYGNSPREEIVKKLFRCVEEWIGTKYEYGGNTKLGIDCSGFVQQVYKEVFNINLPREVKVQQTLGIVVEGNYEPGDLLFFNIDGSISHVGIYVFDNKFIHAASSGPQIGVIKSSLDEEYYKKRFVFARRIIKLPPYKTEPAIAENTDTKENNIEKNEKVNLKEEKPINENFSIKGQLIFGKKFVNGNIYQRSSFFESNSDIYLKVQLGNLKSNLFKIVFFNENNKIVKEHTINEKNNPLFFILQLKKGNYTVKLITESEEILDEKMIFVD